MKATLAYLHFKTLDSTHLWCKRELTTVSKYLEDAQCLLVTCDKQTAGIGRRGSAWKTGALHLSLELCFELPALLPASLSLCIADALAQYLQSKSIPAKLKWPNDIWTSRGKIAGLILETVSSNSKSICLLGLGLNISDPLQIDEETSEIPSIDQPVDYALRYLVEPPSLELMALEIAQHLLKAIESQELTPIDVSVFMRGAWTCPGARTEAILEEGHIEGIIVGFDLQGDMILRTSHGEEKRLRSGSCKKVRVLEPPKALPGHSILPTAISAASCVATQTTTRDPIFTKEP